MQIQSIQSKQQFLHEFNRLLRELEGDISNLSQYARESTDEKTREVIGGINRLKLYHKNLQELYRDVTHSDDFDWKRYQSKAEELFNNIRDKASDFSKETSRAISSHTPRFFAKQKPIYRQTSTVWLGLGALALGGAAAWFLSTEQGKRVLRQGQDFMYSSGVSSVVVSLKNHLIDIAATVGERVSSAAEKIADQVGSNLNQSQIGAGTNGHRTNRHIESAIDPTHGAF